MLSQPSKKSQWNLANKPIENDFQHFSIQANFFFPARASTEGDHQWEKGLVCTSAGTGKDEAVEAPCTCLLKMLWVSILPFHMVSIHVPQGNMLSTYLFSSFHWQTGFKSKLLQTFTPLKCQMESTSHPSQMVNHLHIRHSGLTHLPAGGTSFLSAKYSLYSILIMGRKQSVNGQDWLWATRASLASPNSPNIQTFFVQVQAYI